MNKYLEKYISTLSQAIVRNPKIQKFTGLTQFF